MRVWEVFTTVLLRVMMFLDRMLYRRGSFSCGPKEYVVFIFKDCEFAGIVSNMVASWMCMSVDPVSEVR